MKLLIHQLFSRPLFAMELLATSLFINLLGLATSIYVIQILNRYVAHGLDSTLITLTSGVLLAIVLEFLFRNIRLKLAQGITVRPYYKLALGVFSMITRTRSTALEQLPGGTQKEIMTGLNTIGQSHGPTTLTTLLDVPFACLFIVALFLLEPMIAGIAAGFISVAFLLTAMSHLPMGRIVRLIAQISGKSATLASSALRKPDTVRAFNAAHTLQQRWQTLQSDISREQRRVEQLRGLVQTSVQSLGALMGVAVIATGAVLAVAGEMDVGMMIGANILAGRAMSPIMRLAQLGAAFAASHRALETLSRCSALPQERKGGTILQPFSGQITLQDITFTHPSATKTPQVLFSSLSLTLQPGSTLVVAGRNGSGKTTLARLMMGLLEPTQGKLLLDGVRLDQIALPWWRSQVAYLPQEPSFMEGTLHDNLLILNPELDEAELNKITKTVDLNAFLHSSPDGLHMTIQQDGANLPVGIRKRLALARAMTSQGKIALLDEPMEGLDGEGRAMLTGVISRWVAAGKSVILFSHDAELIRGADMILNLNQKPKPHLMLRQEANPAKTPAKTPANSGMVKS